MHTVGGTEVNLRDLCKASQTISSLCELAKQSPFKGSDQEIDPKGLFGASLRSQKASVFEKASLNDFETLIPDIRTTLFSS